MRPLLAILVVAAVDPGAPVALEGDHAVRLRRAPFDLHPRRADGHPRHVPARVVKGYLRGKERKRAKGLAVPGMPVGSPGMEMPNRPAQPYRVIAFQGDGRAGVYSSHNQNGQ